MKSATLIAALVLAIPVGAAAQPQGAAAPVGTDGPTIAADPVAFQPAPRPRGAKRKGSMVGYIEDSTIRTQFRVRFDGGWGIDSPDRAEFFYAKCGCYRDLAGSPLLDADAPGPGPGIVTDLDYRQFNVFGEYAVNDRLSIFGELPIRQIQPEAFVPGTGTFENQSGIGDIKAGIKYSLLSDDLRDLTLLVRTSLPTGDALKGMGTDSASFEPALLYRQDVNERVSVESQFGIWNPIGGSRGPLATDGNFSGSVLYYGIGPSFDAVTTDTLTFSPVVELIGWRVLRGFETKTLLTPIGGDASGVNIVNLKIGARTTMTNGGSFYFGIGFGLTDAVWYDKMLRLEYRAGF